MAKKEFILSDWIVDDDRATPNKDYIHKGYVEQFIQLFKEELKYNVDFIDKLAGDKLTNTERRLM